MESRFCHHNFISTEGHCLNCGVVIEVYSSPETMTGLRKSGATISGEIAKFDIPDIVKQKAIEISQKIGNQTRRSEMRKKMFYFCIYNAFREIGDPRPDVEIANLVGLDVKVARKSIKTFSTIQTGYQPIKMHILPQYLIPDLCEAISMQEYNQIIVNLCGRIIDKCKSLLEEQPGKVAVGMILYYSQINNLDLAGHTSILLEKAGFSKPVIMSMRDRIAKIDNS